MKQVAVAMSFSLPLAKVNHALRNEFRFFTVESAGDSKFYVYMHIRDDYKDCKFLGEDIGVTAFLEGIHLALHVGLKSI